MIADTTRRSNEAEKEQQPGDLSSFNNRDKGRSTETEDTQEKGKDVSESYSDYNGNSEANAPVKE